MTAFSKPSEGNGFLVEHMTVLRNSLRHWTERELVHPDCSAVQAARQLFYARFVILSHNTAADPVFTYGNRAALILFEMSWEEFTLLPSRQSAEPIAREERTRLLSEVTQKGFIDNYSGVRISRSGRRFLITNATVWNLLDHNGNYYGQAATFSEWEYL